MLGKKMQDALNEQLRAEMYSSNLYLAMAAYLDDANLGGFAHWLAMQAKEEMGHAMRFYAHIKERLGRVTIGAIDAPAAEWDSPLAVFEAVYNHECVVTAAINDLLKLACDEDDSATAAFLQWFVTEQVEEEAQADAVVQKLKMIGKAAAPLLMFDAAMGKRDD